jgi:hypothetical protein
MILGMAMAMMAPAAVMAAERGGGGHGYSGGGGHGYSGGGGHGYSGGEPGGYRGGGSVDRGGYRGGGRDRDYRGGYYAPGYRYGYGFGLGYSYAPNPCNPGGYYDQWGRWIAYPGCYVPPYGY